MASGPGPTGQLGTLRAETAPATSAASPAEPARSAASPSPEEVAAAQRHFDSGVNFFERGNYAAARSEFEAAYQLSRYPQLLYNLAKTAEKLNQPAEAIRYLEQYLATSPPASDAAEVREKLTMLQKASSGVSAATPPAQSKIPPRPALALLGAGAGLLLVGIGFGVASLQAGNTVSQETAYNATAITCDVLGGAGIAAGAAWIGYWLYQRHKARNPAPPAVSLSLGGPGSGIAVRF